MKQVHLAFLGCGFISRVHSRHLRAMKNFVVRSYASRDGARAAEFCRELGGSRHYGSYAEALADPAVDAVVVAVPPRYHLELTLAALERGKHALVEKPAFPNLADYRTAIEARDRAGRAVIVGENDHYKPLAIELRRLVASGAIGELVLCHFNTVCRRPKKAGDWRNDESLAGGDAFFEEGIHWLHLASSLGPSIRTIQGYRPPAATHEGAPGDVRRKSMLATFQYDTGAAGALYYSREVPAFFRGIGLSMLLGRQGTITFESNGGFIFVNGARWPRLVLPGFRDIRGYRAMYRDFVAAIREGRQPEMSLERAEQDHDLMERVVQSAGTT